MDKKPIKPTRQSLIFLDKSFMEPTTASAGNNNNNDQHLASVPEQHSTDESSASSLNQPVILRRKLYQKNSSQTSRHSEIPMSHNDLANANTTVERRISKVPSVTEDLMSGDPIRMTGYLEKRSKMLGWKKFWFVLDGHLLTYYKSKEEYERLSSFSGSINLGIASTVRPIQTRNSKAFPLQITTRSHVYYLKAPDKQILEQWVLALQETISIPHKISGPTWSSPGAQFYRYSFAALSDSQWSINDPATNLSDSLTNLPKNFYLKPDGPSFISEEFKPLKTKCHSCATLPTTALSASPKISKMSTKALGIGNSARSSNNRAVVRPATSMLVLESSPQATELKKELAKKLSIGNATPSSIRNNNKLASTTSSESFDRIKFIDDESSQTDLSNVHEYSEISELKGMGKFGANVGDNIYESIDFNDNNSSSNHWKRKSNNEQESKSNRNSLLAISETPEPESQSSEVILPKSKLHELPKLDNNNLGSVKGLQGKKKKSGIGGLFQKMFKKDGSESSKRNAESKLDISGPVDLREHLKIANTPSPSNQPAPAPTISPIVLSELKSRVGQIHRTISDGPGDRLQSQSQELLRRTTIEAVAPCASEVFTNTNRLNYHEKLAMFNRLSATFIANNNLPNGSSSNFSRSHSCRIKTNVSLDNLPPRLPPKKKNLDNSDINIPEYDVPRNNAPVDQSTEEMRPGEPRIASLRELLSKKNSAPDILYEVPPAPVEKKAKTPPRPPKKPTPIPPTHELPCGLVSQKEHYEQMDKEKGLQFSSSLASTLQLPNHGSPTLSSRSMDIDNLDVLSDFSDLQSNSEAASPPGSPLTRKSSSENEEVMLNHEDQNRQKEIVHEYANLKFATVNTILTELETVEEIAESMDEFLEETTPIPEPMSLTYENFNFADLNHTSNNKPKLRTSGIDELQKYLQSEVTDVPGGTNKTGRVNRLGHSSAINKLQDALRSEN